MRQTRYFGTIRIGTGGGNNRSRPPPKTPFARVLEREAERKWGKQPLPQLRDIGLLENCASAHALLCE
jgi:hypothetical protein